MKVKILLLILLEVFFTSSQVLEEFVFNPFPISSIQLKDYCSEGKLLSNLLVINNKNLNLFLGWSQECGLYLFKIEEPFKIYSQKIKGDAKNIRMIYQQQNTQIIWIVENQKITVYLLNISTTTLQFTQVKEIQLESNLSPCLDILESVQRQSIILVYDTQILYLNSNQQSLLESKFQIKQTDSAIFSMFLLNEKFAIFGIGVDLILYEYLEFDVRSDSVVSIKNCNLFKLDQSNPIKLIMMKNNFFSVLTNASGIVFGYFDLFLQTKMCADITFQWYLQDKKYTVIKYPQIYMSSSYLILEEAFHSIKLIQLSYSSTIQTIIYQQISIKENTNSLIASNDQQYIISLTQNSINFYQKVKSNYKNKIPSILSVDDNILFNSFTQKAKLAWRCSIEKDLFFYSKASDGVIVLRKDPINYTLNPINIYLFDPGMYEVAMPIKGTTNLVVGNNKLYFVSYQDVLNPVVYINSNFGISNLDADHVQISKDQKTLFVAAGQPGLLIINISDFKNPALISQINYSNSQQTTTENLQTFNNDQYVFITYRYLGIALFDVRNLGTPSFVSFIPIKVAEDLSISSNGKFMVVSNYEYGISIIDISDITKMFEVSKIQVEGSTLRAHLIYNDQYILSTSQLRGQLQLIDIRDLKNPKVIQEYQYNYQDKAYDVCISDDQKKGYLAMGDGIVQFNLFNDKNINVNIIDMSNENLFNYFDRDAVFHVGQKIGIQISEIFPSPERKLMIFSAYFNNKYHIEALPKWAQFNILNQILIITIQKESVLKEPILNESTNKQIILNNNQLQEYTQQFILEIKEQLFDQDFIYLTIGITQLMSQDIFKLCQSNEIINSMSYVIKFSQNIINQTFKSTYNQKQINHILYILKQKSTTFPIFLQLRSSLKFDIQQNIIITESNQVSVLISCIENEGEFIKINYSGALVFYSQKHDYIQIEGTLANINNILKNKIRFQNFKNPNDIKLNVTISDHLNFDIIQETNASNNLLIQLNKPISINKDNNLQKDFESKFDGSSFSTLTEFEFTFNSNIFFDENDSQITYNAYISENDKLEEISQDYWLQFEPKDRRFYGKTRVDQYKQKIKILVNATNGYTYITDTFYFNIDQVPPIFVIQILLEILFPMFCIFVLWTYKYKFINLFRKTSNKKSPISLEIGKEYFIQIPLLENCLKDAIKIWKSYKHTIVKDIVLREITYLRMENKQNFQQEPVNETNSLHLINSPALSNVASPVLSAQNSPKDSSYKFNFNDTISKDINTSKDKNNSKESKNFKDIRKLSRKISRKVDLHQSKIIQKKIQAKVNLQSVKANIYFLEDGSINRKGIIESIQQWSMKFVKSEQIQNQIQNPQSKLCSVLIGLVVRYFAQIDETTHKILEFLKKAAIEEGILENDWYKAYTILAPDAETIIYQCLPQVYFIENKIEEKLQLLKSMETNIKQSEFLLPLIQENLKAFAFGFTTDSRGVFPNNRGECIDAHPHQIKCIKAFCPVIKKTCLNKNKIEIVSMEKELSLNSLLPSWIKSVDIINGSIFFIIQAHAKDQGEYQLRIISTQYIILKVIIFNIGHIAVPQIQGIQEDEENQKYTHQQQNNYMLQSKSQMQESRSQFPDSRLQLPESHFQVPDSPFSVPDSLFKLPFSPFKQQYGQNFPSSDPPQTDSPNQNNQSKQDDITSQSSCTREIPQDEDDDNENNVHQSPKQTPFFHFGSILQEQTMSIQESCNRQHSTAQQ